jgi:hypothetical protein
MTGFFCDFTQAFQASVAIAMNVSLEITSNLSAISHPIIRRSVFRVTDSFVNKKKHFQLHAIMLLLLEWPKCYRVRSVAMFVSV